MRERRRPRASRDRFVRSVESGMQLPKRGEQCARYEARCLQHIECGAGGLPRRRLLAAGRGGTRVVRNRPAKLFAPRRAVHCGTLFRPDGF